ncbi:PAS domain-containing sensor histidine kinase [Poseidonibacter ostreae]|uniref:histidine kinase n=1 Tax=Poseidonibacter ostreae TaxID=2654171 RepID=A0A6L4WTR6_9BACT|nr:PAS domain-containing sensor histidine kinase [Poseidonibacter ostreae]KAB7889442.1 PAS domain S-box protein [Poseidonibacter ostreae]KAB7892545.1 PAS domain S-box protein [Poseidonibacter ostreae]
MLLKLIKKDINLLFIGSLVILFFITAGIIASSSILKEETIDNQLTISKLKAEFLAEELNQSINTIEVVINNITSIVNLDDSKVIINNKLSEILRTFPQIRSLNILDKNSITYSSNKSNIGYLINDNEFYPKPLFNNSILRVAYPLLGRDFFTSKNILDAQTYEKPKSLIIPIMKETYIKDKEFVILIALNADYLLNTFRKRNEDNKYQIELLRADRVLLLSNVKEKVFGKKEEINFFIEKALEKNNYSGVHFINNEKFISSYSLTKDYPLLLGVHVNYKKSLLSWNQKSYKFFVISIGIVVVSILIVLILFLLYRKGKSKEILAHKKQLNANNKFKLLFENSHFLSAVINPDGKIDDINKKGLEFLGKDIASLRNKSFWDLECWQNDEKIRIKKLLSNYKSFLNIDYEVSAMDSEKKYRVLEFVMSAISSNDKGQLILVGIDITQRKEKEKKLQQAYTVFNNTKDGIVITDKYTNIIDVNNSFEKITAYSKLEVVNKRINLLKSNLHDKNFYKKMWKDLKVNGFWEGEIINLKKDRTLYTQWLTISTIYSQTHEVLNYIGIFSDITERKNKDKLLKEKEALLFQQSKMASMGEMIENIAHQWRQPLSVISTTATGIKMQKELGILKEKDEFENLDMINTSAQYLSQTIEDFKDFLRTDKKLEMFKLENTLNSAIKLISSKFKNRNITIVIDNQDIEIYGLKNEFVQVIMNILSNAKDALENIDLENKYVFINSFIDKEHIFIQIKDNAGGIPLDIINKICEPYFTTKHQSKGTGIGLYMSEEIIKNHMKGSLHIRNEEFEYKNEKYKGACFEIKIPK